MTNVLLLLALLQVPSRSVADEARGLEAKDVTHVQCLMQRVTSINGHHEEALEGSALLTHRNPDGHHKLLDRLPGQNDEPWRKRRARAVHVLEQWVMCLQDFMLSIAWTAIIVGLFLNLTQQYTSWCLPRLQALEIHVLLSIVMLAACTSLTGQHHGTNYCLMELSLRYVAEGYMLLVGLFLIPSRLNGYMIEALEKEIRLKVEKKASPDAPFKRQGTTLGTPMHRQRTTLAVSRSLPGTNSGTLDNTHRLTASDSEGMLKWMILLLCALRPACCIIFHLMVSLSNGPSQKILVLFSVLNLCILIAGLGFVHRETGDALTRISEYLALYQIVSLVIAFLPLLGAVEDIAVIVLFGTENLGVAFASQMYLHQVVGAFLFTAYKFAPCNHPLVRLRDVDRVEAQSEWWACIKYCFDPRNIFRCSRDHNDDVAVRTFLVLVRWVRADQEVKFTSDGNVCLPHELTEQEVTWKKEGRLEQKTNWRHVLFDVSTSRVRSPLISAAALTIVVDLSLALVGPINHWIQTLNVGIWFGLAILAVQLLWAISIWMVCGLLLVGNNVFMQTPWLSIAVIFFLTVASRSFYVFFLPPQYLAEDFGLLWRNFFRGCAALVGLMDVLRSCLAPVASNYFFQIEITAMRYTRSLFSGLLKGASLQRIQAVRSVNSTATWYPPVLIAAAMASVPLVLATSYFMVLSTMDVLHHAEELQLSMEIINPGSTTIKTEKLTQGFVKVFDRNHDRQLERDELEGLFLGLESLGLREAGEQVFADVTTEGGRLGKEEVPAFINHLRLVASAAELFAGDIAPHILAERLLHTASNPCLTAHQAGHVMRTAMLAMSPGTGELIPRRALQSASAAAAFGDLSSCLTIEQASAYLSVLRHEFTKSRGQVQQLVRQTLEMRHESGGHDTEDSLLHELRALDVNGDGLSIREVQPLLQAMGLVSQNLKASVASVFSQADFDKDSRLSMALESKHEEASSDATHTGSRRHDVSESNTHEEHSSTQGSKHYSDAELLEQEDGRLLKEMDRREMQKSLLHAIRSLEAISHGHTIQPQKEAAVALRLIWQRITGAVPPNLYSNETRLVTLQATSSARLHKQQLKKTYNESTSVPVSFTGEISEINNRVSQQTSSEEMMAISKLHAPEVVVAEKFIPLEDEEANKATDETIQNVSELKTFVRNLQPMVRRAIQQTNGLLEYFALENYDAAAKFMLRFYDFDHSRSLSKSELSDALAPTTAALYPVMSANELTTSAMLPRVADADSDGVLDATELPFAARLLRNRLLVMFGDVNHDGVTDSADLLIVARSDDADKQNESMSSERTVNAAFLTELAMMQVDSRIAPRKVSGRRASFLAGIVHQSMGPVAAPGVDFFPRWQQDFVKRADEFLQSVPIRPVRICVLLSGVVAVVFSLYILSTAFRGYARLFGQMQTGRREFKGHSFDLRSSHGMSTLFLGMVMSMMVCGWILCYVVVLALSGISMLILADMWLNPWNAISFIMLFLVASLVLFLCRFILSRKLKGTNGEITFPTAFACTYVVLIVISFVFGVLASVFRFLVLLPIMAYRFFSLDQTMCPERFAYVDPGYFSLLALTYGSHQNLNPLRHSFISFINKTAHRLYGPSFKTSAEVCNWDQRPDLNAGVAQRQASTEEIQRAARRRVIRNRLWLAYTLYNNPGLSFQRGRFLQGERASFTETEIIETSHEM